MLKLRVEKALILLALLCLGVIGYRYLQRPLQRQNETPAETFQSATVPKYPTHPLAAPPLPLNKKAQPMPPLQPQGSGSGPTKMAKYNELLNDPLAGLDRLHLLEQMQSEMSQDEISLRAYYEVLNNGPAPEYSAEENHQRRNIVSVAFGMYLENCLNFEACYQYVVAGLARYPDPEIFKDLYSQVQDKYPQDWQRDKIVAEMKKYGMVKDERRKK